MKKLVMLALLLGTTSAYAYQIQGNPDWKPSLGLTYSRTALKGDYNAPTFRTVIKDAADNTINNYVADIRLPLSTFLTFNIGGGYTSQNMRLSAFDPKESWEMNGYNLSVGARIYFK